MTLFSPWNLLWLVPLAGGIIALWMLRRKRQDVTVSSLLLWQALLQDTQTNTPFRKLQRNLLLFLQLLTAFLLIFALARPFVYGRGLTGRTLVVVIDTTASMAATDTRPTRLDAAKDEAKDYLRREMNGTDAATVIASGTRPETIVGLTSDRARLEDAVDKVAPTDAPGDLAAAMTLAQSLARGRAGSQIRVFTDGALGPGEGEKIAALPFGGTQVRQQAIGSPSATNVAITALDFRRNPDTGHTEVFVAVRRFGSGGPVGGTLSLLLDGKLVDARAISLQSRLDDETFDSALLQRGGVVTARLDDIHDDLDTDNAASIVIPAAMKRRILLVSNGNLFLEKALNADPDTTLEECPPSQFATAGRHGVGYALVVFDHFLPDSGLPPVNALTFGVINRQTPLTPTGGALKTPPFLDATPTHPVMRFVNLEGVHIRAALNSVTQPSAMTLAEGRGGPWIAARESGGHRMISVAFDLADTDWPLRVSFPIFIANAVDWLSQGGLPGAVSPQTPAGEPFSVVVPPGLSSLVVASPNGHVRTVVAPSVGGIVSFADTSHVGLYHVSSENGVNYPVAVNLLNATASDLTPREVDALDHTGLIPRPADIPPAKRARQDLWPPVAAMALLVLLLEWALYHRR